MNPFADPEIYVLTLFLLAAVLLFIAFGGRIRWPWSR